MEERVESGLEAFVSLQQLYLTVQDAGGAETVREHVSGLVEPFDLDVEAIVSVAGSRVGNAEALATCIATVAPSKMEHQISAAVDEAEPSSAGWNFGVEWRDARKDGHGETESGAADAFETALSGAIASNDVGETGRLLMSKDVNTTWIKARHLPAKLLRKPRFRCPVLEIAVGSGAVDVAKSLLEFHGARPTRETLKMALSSGNFELVRICWERLPDEQQQRNRRDLLEVASDFHQLEILAWLFRDADGFERELFIDFAIRRGLADALLAVLVDGFRPWWAVTAAAKWAPTREIEFGPAPEGFWPDGGWFTNAKGETNGIRAMDGRWTRNQTESELGMRAK
jgi:hypothetical protein